MNSGDRKHRLALQVLGKLSRGFPHCCGKELILLSAEVRLQGWGSLYWQQTSSQGGAKGKESVPSPPALKAPSIALDFQSLSWSC